MAKTPLRNTVPSLFTNDEKNGIIEVSKLTVPNTAIANRADIIDLANDMSMNFGINRIQTQETYEIQGESGPSGELVYGAVNDKFDQIRFYGPGADSNDAGGQFLIYDNAEITFYGTGLNILINSDAFVRSIQVSVDSGAFGGNLNPTAASTILNQRNYSPNQVLNLVTGETLGLHTVKIQMTGTDNPWIHGFEILNESTTLDINPGITYINDFQIDHAGVSSAYNSGWTNESGTLGAKGGCVIVYQDETETVKKDIQWTEVSQLNLTAANHSNEEVIRTHNFYEFGAGRADDFSTTSPPVAGSPRAFTLDDGTTTLVGDDVRPQQFGTTINYLTADSGVGSFFTLTFVGTGLDVTYISDVISRTTEFIIDGVNVGSINKIGAQGEMGTEKIVSGLPYGTHTIKFRNLAAGDVTWGVKDFIIYGPKKPTLPTDSVELGSYYLMADFVANTTQSDTDISVGTLRKSPSREFIYAGGSPAITLSASTRINGHYVHGATTYEHTFFGTGLDLRFDTQGTTSNMTIDIDGSTDHSSLTTNLYSTGVSFVDTTGVFSGTASAFNGGLTVSGLSLGLHTVTLTKNSGNIGICALDVITPIHSPKNNGPHVVQNTLSIGSTALTDARVIDEISAEEAKQSKAIGIVDGPSTTQITFVPFPEMHVTYESEGEYVSITGSACLSNTSIGNYATHTFVVDGKHVGSSVGTLAHANSYYDSSTNEHVMYLSAGIHDIQMYWRTTTGTAVANNIGGGGAKNDRARYLIVKKI